MGQGLCTEKSCRQEAAGKKADIHSSSIRTFLIQLSCSFVLDENAGVCQFYKTFLVCQFTTSSESVNCSVKLSSIMKLKDAIIRSKEPVTCVRHFIIRTHNDI